MTTKFSSKTPKSFNIWRKIFQYIACKVIINIARTKYSIKVEGLENIDKKKKYVVASNHVTGFDPFLIAAALHMTIAFMAKKQLFETFWSMLLVDWCGAFAVDREKVDISTIKTALAIKQTNWHLGLFPQGTRCNNGKIENVTKGFASIAKKIQADILPVAIVIKDNNSNKKKNMTIIAGKPIPYNDNVENTVEQWCNTICEISGLEYSHSSTN